MLDEVLINNWRVNVYERAREVDPDNERDWFDLAYGYFLGRGKEPTEAYDLAVEVCYQKKWC